MEKREKELETKRKMEVKLQRGAKKGEKVKSSRK
jgi:hypothetical protein